MIKKSHQNEKFLRRTGYTGYTGYIAGESICSCNRLGSQVDVKIGMLLFLGYYDCSFIQHIGCKPYGRRVCGGFVQPCYDEYESIKNYFSSFFNDADICILSSHSHPPSIQHIKEMMAELASRGYNVAGVFWSNDFGADAQKIASLAWQERLWIENPPLQEAAEIAAQIRKEAYEFAEMLVARAYAQ